MADISVLSRLFNGAHRNVDLTTNTLTVLSIKINGTELVKADLDKLLLIKGQADSDGTFDTKYYRKTALNATTDGASGASLIGIDQTPAFTNFTPTGATVQGALEGIDSALATAGGSEFADNLFRVKDNTDATKKLAFEVSGITTATTRTITIPDSNLNLSTGLSGSFANSTLSNLGTTAINASLTPSSDNTLLFGTGSARWAFVNAATVVTSWIQSFDSTNAINTDNRNLLDLTEVLSVDWHERKLFYGDGVTPAVHWTAALLKDDTDISSVAWNVRNLLAPDGTTVMLNWAGTDLEVNSKITGLSAATANGDAVRFQQAVLTDGSHDITGNQSFGGTAKITNLVDPTNAQDGATKAYVDAAVAGLSWKQAVHVASTADVSIATAPASIDGHTLASLERILLKNQTAPEENGLYVFNGTGNALTRSSDADTWNEIVGLVVYVEQGTVNGGSKYVNTNLTGGTLGTTAITFTIFSAANAIDGTGTTGYNAYWTAAQTLAAEQYVAPSRGGLGLDGSALSAGLLHASGSGTFSSSLLVNADISGSAAIAYAKLALTNSIVDADVNASAAIAYSKLALTGSIVNADINASAAIAYSKLALTGAILNADLAGSIADSKLLTISTANKVSGSAIQLTATSGLQDNTGLELKLDGTTLAKSSSGVKVDTSGITANELAADSVTTVKILNANVTLAKLASDSVDENKIKSTSHDGSLAGGSGTVLSVNYAPSIQSTVEIAGEALSATTIYALRYGQDAETAGRMYKADLDATSTDNFYAIGLVKTVGALSAADPIPAVTKFGPMTATSHGFTVGKPVYLSASGALTSTAPTTANYAVVRVGVVKDANTIDVNVQVVGIN